MVYVRIHVCHTGQVFDLHEGWRNPPLHKCACTQLRKLSRETTSLYSQYLKPSGLTITQYGLLACISQKEAMAPSELGMRMGMDRTTVVRNLKPLSKQGYIREVVVSGSRLRPVAVTPKGFGAMETVYPLWQLAQTEMARLLGASQFEELTARFSAASAQLSRSQSPEDAEQSEEVDADEAMADEKEPSLT